MGQSQSITDRDNAPNRLDTGRVAIIALFITALITSQLTASKILAFEIPFSLPVTGSTLILPGAALGIAVMFFASDCYAELYGRKEAHKLVNVGFFMNFVMLALVWSTIAAPASQTSVDPDTFAAVLGQGTNIVIASLLAYIVSQNWDVFAFHKIKEYTQGEYLWLRNIGSTATSQAIDTVIFVTVGFYVAPQILGGFLISSPTAILSLIIGQYILKLLIAFVDTPFVYVVVGYIRSYQEDKVRTEVA